MNVLITGGTAGIGLGVARHFADGQAHVVITGRRNAGFEIAQDIGAVFVPMDLNDEDSIVVGVNRCVESLGGRIDVLILNAGIDRLTGPIDALDFQAFREVFEVNVFGLVKTLATAQSSLPSGASVIITSSPAGTLAASGMGAYGASKSAANYLTRVFAAELAGRGIRVNAVLPGLVESEMSGSTGSTDFIRSLTLSGQVRSPEELAPTFEFLASPWSAPLTGAIVGADDGMSAALSPEATRRINAGRKGEMEQ